MSTASRPSKSATDTSRICVAGALPARMSASDGTVVSITITDSGVGISQEQRARLFEPFFTTKTNGTGLGLAMSQSIVQQHGGCINLESEAGNGTTFTVTLPAYKEMTLAEPGVPV